MYIHSWQSLIWNKIVSWRIRELGRTIRVGDIVRSKREQPGSQNKKQLEKSKLATEQSAEVEFVTEEKINSYSIEDVVMPLPGWDVQLPKNECEYPCISCLVVIQGQRSEVRVMWVRIPLLETAETPALEQMPGAGCGAWSLLWLAM